MYYMENVLLYIIYIIAFKFIIAIILENYFLILYVVVLLKLLSFSHQYQLSSAVCWYSYELVDLCSSHHDSSNSLLDKCH
jgi:hypothetical protein